MLVIVCKKFPGFLVFLDVLCCCFGIDNSNWILYGVFLDFEILVEVYLELIGGC